MAKSSLKKLTSKNSNPKNLKNSKSDSKRKRSQPASGMVGLARDIKDHMSVFVKAVLENLTF